MPPSVGPHAAGAGLGAERDLLGDLAAEPLEARVVARRRPAAPSSPSRSRASSTIERPSGVSSRIDDDQRGREHLGLATPGAAVIDAARRLP